MRVIELDAPVVGENLIGREEWVQRFIDNVVDKPNTVGAYQYALVAPRRTGKTSILMETFNRLFYRKPAGDELIPLFFNLEEILRADPIDAFPELYLLQLYACIINFRIGKPVYYYHNLKMPEALELSKTHGFHDFLTRTLDMMEYDRSRGGFPAFRVVALPGEISRETGQAFAVFVDEVQEALEIWEKKGPNILMAYRNCWDFLHHSPKKAKVYHVFTGSAASLVSKEVLGGESCLFGRIYHKDLFPLTPPAVNQLVDFHTDGPVPEWTHEARTALYEITGGHPFYAKCLIKNFLELQEPKPTTIEVPQLEAAYKKELSFGIIYKTLKDDFSKYLSRYKDPGLLEQILKRIVDTADEEGFTTPKELHQVPGWDPEAAKYLEDCDIIQFNSYVCFLDPVFRDWFKYIYWVYIKEKNPVEESELDFDDTTARRLVNDIGFLFQRLVRMVTSFFNGQTVSGTFFGWNNSEVIFPVISSAKVEWSFYWPSSTKQEKEYRFDVTGFGKDKDKRDENELWFVECKYWQSRKVGIPQLKELTVKKEKFRDARQFKGKLVCWFCTKNKLNPPEQEFCRKNNIYFSCAEQVEQLLEHLRQIKTS
jgi:predicted AAA+ superfamily ATPase